MPRPITVTMFASNLTNFHFSSYVEDLSALSNSGSAVFVRCES